MKDTDSLFVSASTTERKSYKIIFINAPKHILFTQRANTTCTPTAASTDNNGIDCSWTLRLLGQQCCWPLFIYTAFLSHSQKVLAATRTQNKSSPGMFGLFWFSRVKCRVSQGCGVTRSQPERRLHSVTSELSKAADGHRGPAHCWGCLPRQAAFKLHWLPIEKLEKLCVVKPLWRRKTPYRGCQGVVGTLIFRATSWLVTYRAGTSVEKQETVHLYQLTWQSVTESYWPTLNLADRIFPRFTLNGASVSSSIERGGIFLRCHICWTVTGRHLLFCVCLTQFGAKRSDAADLKQTKRTGFSLLTVEQCTRSSLSHNGQAAMKHWQHIHTLWNTPVEDWQVKVWPVNDQN